MTIDAETVVIGAGLCGLTVARGLADAGIDVAVVDKSRGTGGRLATKRAGDLRFDHGAQYIRPKDPAFGDVLSGLAAKGAAAEWDVMGGPAYVGLPGMSGLVKPLAEGLALHAGVEVAKAAHDGTRWVLSDAGGDVLARADRLVSAIPAPQAARLLAGHPLADSLSAVRFDPCWTLMVAFETPLGLPDASRDPQADLAWIARDGAKPGHAGAPEAWVVQASPRWSRDNLERDATDICGTMVMMLGEYLGRDLPVPVHSAAHRWRFSQAAEPLGQPCLSDPETGLVIAGDWCLGRRAEDAWHSAQAALATLGTAAGDGQRRAG